MKCFQRASGVRDVYESSVIFLLAQFKSIHCLFSLIKVSSDFSTEIKLDA